MKKIIGLKQCVMEMRDIEKGKSDVYGLIMYDTTARAVWVDPTRDGHWRKYRSADIVNLSVKLASHNAYAERKIPVTCRGLRKFIRSEYHV